MLLPLLLLFMVLLAMTYDATAADHFMVLKPPADLVVVRPRHVLALPIVRIRATAGRRRSGAHHGILQIDVGR